MKFPYYFQLLSSSDSIANSYHEVIQEYGWKKIALIVQNENLFTVVSIIYKGRNHVKEIIAGLFWDLITKGDLWLKPHTHGLLSLVLGQKEGPDTLFTETDSKFPVPPGCSTGCCLMYAVSFSFAGQFAGKLRNCRINNVLTICRKAEGNCRINNALTPVVQEFVICSCDSYAWYKSDHISILAWERSQNHTA